MQLGPMKALVSIFVIGVFSVAGTGLYAITSESEAAYDLRALFGLNEYKTDECLPLTDECGINEPCDSASKPSCDSKPCCDEVKTIKDQNPT